MRDAGNAPLPRRAVPSHRALCIGLSRFGDYEDEPPAGAYPELPYATPRVTELKAALTSLGYTCQTLGDQELKTAEALGTAVANAIHGADGEALVIHVLSHGRLGKSSVYVVGADGEDVPETSVASWVARIEDYAYARRPHTLFLVDTCHAGAAARLDWLPAAAPDTRAWVIAATPGDSLAYDGRFTQAVANVLARIQAGDIDFYPSEYVPFGHVVEHIRREVVTLGGEGQYVTGTPVDGNPAPPFFPNPRTAQETEVWADLDSATQPFTELDPALDEAHFLDRAKGHGGLGTGTPIGCFTGREHELESLTAWLNDPDGGGLRVVTGGPGSGKSALLGLLVCAAHPALRDRTRRLWEHVPAAPHHPIPDLAAVHLRERDLTETLASLTRQLALQMFEPAAELVAAASVTAGGSHEIQHEPRAAKVVAAITAREHPPVIVFDALDEALTQTTLVQELLLPLAAATRPDGRPACHLLVGMRPWEQFATLRDLADESNAVIDLDEVPTDRLRDELAQYIRDLLDLAPGYSRPADLPVRRSIAQRSVGALTQPGRERGGEFLAAGLFVNWVLTRRPDGATPAEAAELTARVPRDARDLLELDLDSHADQPWFRPILLTLAHARGAGMPATVVRRLAPLCRAYDRPGDARGELTVTEFDQALRQVRFYLRSSADTDGTTLYRLFHQGLVDQLREEDIDLSALVVALLATAPKDPDGRRRWDAAEPYVQRHGLQHAADAGHLDELLSASRKELEPVLGSAITALGRVSSAVCRESTGDPDQDGPPARRDLMAVNAVRYGFPGLAARLNHIPGLPGHGWWPAWATGGELPLIPQAVLPGHTDGVHTVACGRLHGRSVAVTCGLDQKIRVWDLVTGQPAGDPVNVGPHVCHTMACTELAGRSVAVTGAFDGQILVWDLAAKRLAGDPIMAHEGGVNAVACAQVGGRVIAVTGGEESMRFWDLAGRTPIGGSDQSAHDSGVSCITCAAVDDSVAIVVAGGDDGKVRVWDVETRRLLYTLPALHHGPPSAVACTVLDGDPIVVLGWTEETVVWDVAADRPLGVLQGHVSRVTAVACVHLDGRPVAVTAGGDGTVGVWDLATGHPVGGPLRTGERLVHSMACAEVGGRALAVVGGATERVSVWDLGDRRSTGDPLIGHSAEVAALTSTTIGRKPIVISGGYDHAVRIWDSASGLPISDPMDADGRVLDVDCAPLRGRRAVVAFGHDDIPNFSRYAPDTVRAFDVAPRRRRMAGRPLLTGYIHGLAYTTVNSWPAAVTVNLPSERLGVWSLTTARLLRALRIKPFDFGALDVFVWCTQFGRRPVVITSADEMPVQIWDFITGEAVGKPIIEPGGVIRAVAPVTIRDHPVLVTSSEDEMVRAWDPARGLLFREFAIDPRGPVDDDGARIRAMTCSTVEGRTLVVAGGGDSVVRVWDLLAGTLLDSFVFPATINALSITDDGDIVVGFGWEVAVLRRIRSRKAVP